ncbi:NADH-quinone oxidoreductase subunit B family protein [Hydrogenimonas cancrithermarum]|uniref:Hydrogenase small subunit n=1 Tax=Hydrogenimonas cancrithermarum TaxID=2993563 RepID=A0ABN6WTS1_9BACT|nr:hydrogenase [Hydrogenimonas cancrithermarum]BDY12500.1 hydrogenase small subunit [Hydrogenimonas cancrithermarum]
MRPKVLWLQGITCNGNSHSFLNATDFGLLCEQFDFVHHPLFPTSVSLEDVASKRLDVDILIVEGAVRRTGFKRAGVEVFELIEHYGAKAEHIVCAGNCAAFGGIFRQYDPEAIGGMVFRGDKEEGVFEKFAHKTVNLPGCPLHPQWLAYTLRMFRSGREIRRDKLLRPLELYAYTVHEGCLRNEYFEWKIDAESFGRKEGCLFYEQGCQGPFTHGSCNKILWNEVSSKTRAGMPCIGCTEPDFPSSGLFETKTLMSIPARLPLDVPKRAYLTLAGMAKAFKIPRLQKRKLDED